MVLKRGHLESRSEILGKFRNVVPSAGSIVLEMKYYTESRRRELSYKQQKRKNSNWIGHILCRNCLLKYVISGKLEARSGGKTSKKT
jgi:hypothetical protein